MMDSEKESSTCAICFDSFLHPKLLSCRHTFCKPCLVDYTKKVKVDEIVCPLCRQRQCLDDRGLDGLMDNYFVCLRPPEVAVIQCCDICFEEAEINQCHHCTQKLCHSCNSSHNLALKMSGKNTGFHLDSEDSEESDSSDDSAPVARHHLLHSSNISPQTELIAEFVSSFKVPSSYQDDHLNVSCIFPKSIDNCLVVLGGGPEIIECTLKGRPFIRRAYCERINGITNTLDDRILFSNAHEGSIFEMVDESRVDVFAKSDGYLPTSLSTFKDGRIVAAGVPDQRMRFLHKDSGNHGALLIFNIHGNLMKEISRNDNGFLFDFILRVSVNPKNDTVGVADEKKHQVLILTEEGYVIRRYKGTNTNCVDRHLGMRAAIDDFLPMGLCHDQDGNLVIANVIDGTLHILLPNGDMCGFITTKTTRGFDHPTSLCFDSQNRLWVGNFAHGKGHKGGQEINCQQTAAFLDLDAFLFMSSPERFSMMPQG
ncbi:uncharacterized protein LOC125681590 isoform X2 [Ostrea edulis]|uniref:uncharacterized protein LOC125681590 isoform X2 n=1 Tax=Ostrea edulis TaxID=37623 RepID=UPI0024AEFAE2|nr:uncharacterized protein LOC125681590 isoform X2 [Ostrea edulis]